MDRFQERFADFLLDEAFAFDNFRLKSGRWASYMVDFGNISKGSSLNRLGSFYADAVLRQFEEDSFDVIMGPAYKGIALSALTVAALHRDHDVEKEYVFNRKEPKYHAENGEEADRWLVGAKLDPKMRALVVDDAFTTGETKHYVLRKLNDLFPGLEYAGMLVGLDRMELNLEGHDATPTFEEETGIEISSIVTITDVLERLKERGPYDKRKRIEDHIMEYGTPEARAKIQ